MQIRIDFSDLTHEVTFSRTAPQRARTTAIIAVQRASRELMAKIKSITPVDTGRARATWGIFTPQLLTRISTSNPVNPSESIWIVEDDGLSITQGSAVPYQSRLNEGSSAQAPALYLDVAAEQAADELAANLLDDLGKVI